MGDFDIPSAGFSLSDTSYNPYAWSNFTPQNFGQDFSLGVNGIDNMSMRPSVFDLGNPNGPAALGFRGSSGDIVDLQGDRVNSSAFGDEFSNRFNLPSLKGFDAKGIAAKIAEALAAMGGSVGASKTPFGTPQGPQMGGAPRAYDFNTPGYGGKFDSPIDYATKGSAEFMRFLSFLKQISPMLYGDQGMRMQGRG